jgi:phenylalanyl-tRNA synthetase beta chain
MQFSEQWLREWIDPPVTTDELVKQLTMAGLEVESITKAAPHFEGVIICKVLAAAPHPDADKLKICEVDAGQPQPLQIVCGASNVSEGMFVPMAEIGAYLPGDIKIERTMLRGVESEGMLCSAKELGLAEESDGLMALPDDARPGESLREYMRLDDVSIELSLTPNRSDCLGIAGIAREIGVINRLDTTPVLIKSVFNTMEQTLPVKVEVPNDCPRYIGRVLRGIRHDARTPLLIKERLRRSGIRPISPVVDITNYVLLELGQPMHAFDLRQIDGGITVRHAGDAEKIILLDGQEIRLEPGTLLIADDRKPLALAGIMGGEGSGVTDDTRDLFLECAWFEPTVIAGRARRYGLHTDSSHRFERGVDPELQRLAMERATALLLEVVGGEPGPITEVVEEQALPSRPAVTLRKQRLERVLGAALAEDFVTDTLQRLGMAVKVNSSSWVATPPSYRFDIAREEDLIEEVGRIRGYTRLPSALPQADLGAVLASESRVRPRDIRRVLVDRGYHEAVTYSFVSPEQQAALAPELGGIKLANPISQEMSVMRTTLLGGLLQAVQHNIHRQQTRVRLFEAGSIYISQDTGIIEKNMISAVATGASANAQWGQASRAVDFFDIKSDLEALLGLTGRDGEFIFVPTKNNMLHPGMAADIRVAERVVGIIGALHPEFLEKQGLKDDVYVFELELDALLQGSLPTYGDVSKYPSIQRDLALVVDENTAAGAVMEAITLECEGLLQNLELFDVYSGKGIDLGKKSLAFTLTLGESSRTLTDEVVNAVLDRVLVRLAEDFEASLRE